MAEQLVYQCEESPSPETLPSKTLETALSGKCLKRVLINMPVLLFFLLFKVQSSIFHSHCTEFKGRKETQMVSFKQIPHVILSRDP